jgi:hypothetical protein
VGGLLLLFASLMLDPLELVDQILDTRTINASRDGLMRFMIDATQQLLSLPEVAARGLDVARQYWQGLASVKELVDARVACWKFIDSIGSSTDVTDPRARATRAAICTLYEDWGSGSPVDASMRMFDTVTFFVGLVAKDTEERREIVARLQRLLDESV